VFSMRRRVLGFPALVLVLAVVATACGGGGGSSGGTSPSPSESNSSEEGGGTISIGQDQANNHGSKDVASASSLDVEADNEEGGQYYFDPTVLRGSPGQKLQITIDNEGSTKHNFTIESQKIDEDINPGNEVTVTVTFPQSGSVEFFCEYHHSLGMAGELSTT
jgi:plastocyanin